MSLHPNATSWLNPYQPISITDYDPNARVYIQINEYKRILGNNPIYRISSLFLWVLISALNLTLTIFRDDLADIVKPSRNFLIWVCVIFIFLSIARHFYDYRKIKRFEQSLLKTKSS